MKTPKKPKKPKKPMSIKAKDRLLTSASVVVTIAPILTAIGVNFKEYFVYHAAGVQVAFGGMLGVVLVILLAKSQTTILKGVWGYLVVFLMAVFLKPIINDIILLTGAALAGKTVDSVVIQPQLKRIRKKRDSEDTSVLGGELQTLLKEQIKLLGGDK